MKTKVSIALVAVIAVGFGGCAVGTYTVSTDSFKEYISGGSRVAGIAFVNGAPIPLRVQVGALNPFWVMPGDATKVGYNNRSIFTNRNYSLHIGVVVIPPNDKLGKIRGATESWDYSEWSSGGESNGWANVNEKIVLMELSSDSSMIVLTVR